MLRRTHMAVGVTAALALVHPHSTSELLLGAGAAVIGAVISDIDSDSSETHRDANIVVGVAMAAIIALIAVESIGHFGLYRKILAQTSIMRVIPAAAVLLGICAFGKEQPHRSFMHSVLALALMTCCVHIILPLAAPYYAAAFASHLLIDFLNRKGERLLYPYPKGFCLHLCASDGWINSVLLRVCSLTSAGLFVYWMVRICLF